MSRPPWKLRPQKRKTKNVDPKTKVLAGNPAVVLIFLMVIEHALKHQFYMYSLIGYVVYLITKPLIWSEVESDLVVIEAST